MNWPELLCHSFWIQALNEEEAVDEEEEQVIDEDDMADEETNDCEADCLASARCVISSFQFDFHYYLRAMLECILHKEAQFQYLT